MVEFKFLYAIHPNNHHFFIRFNSELFLLGQTHATTKEVLNGEGGYCCARHLVFLFVFDATHSHGMRCHKHLHLICSCEHAHKLFSLRTSK